MSVEMWSRVVIVLGAIVLGYALIGDVSGRLPRFKLGNWLLGGFGVLVLGIGFIIRLPAAPIAPSPDPTVVLPSPSAMASVTVILAPTSIPPTAVPPEPTEIVPETGDTLIIVDIIGPETTLKNGVPDQLEVIVDYKLLSTDSASLVAYLEVFPDTSDACLNQLHQTIQGYDLEITRRAGQLSIPLEWRGLDITPEKEMPWQGSRHSGYVSVGVSLWTADYNTHLEGANAFEHYCIRFEP